MSSSTLSQTLGRYSAQARWSVSTASSRGCGGGSSVEIKASIRGECGEDGWVPSGGEVPLYWWFLAGVVSVSESSVVSSSLGWVKSAIGRTIELIYSSETS